ncbi:MAG: TetR/AcrR family transcriptional regulator [Lachnospiraceae bacterium]|nr:TetR/AcrR family transcriptional regulator [Lachnospiraceae bacterium]
MSDNEKSKNRIIEITTELLKEYNGDTRKITSRFIAERADIGLGSINYFFGSKENLIAECIQRTIKTMLAGFAPDLTDFTKDDGLSDETRLIFWARNTFDFLFENQAIAGISILNDLQNYSADSNSVYTQKGFAFAFRSRHKEETKRLLVFILVSAMQAAFLAKNSAKEILGYDLYSKTERDSFIESTVTMLFHGAEVFHDTDNKGGCCQ